MWWSIIGLVVFIVFLGMISSTVEQEREKEFREESAKQIGELAKWWYSKNKKE